MHTFIIILSIWLINGFIGAIGYFAGMFYYAPTFTQDNIRYNFIRSILLFFVFWIAGILSLALCALILAKNKEIISLLTESETLHVKNKKESVINWAKACLEDECDCQECKHNCKQSKLSQLN